MAVAEATLYLIWQSRRPESTSKRIKPRRRIISARHKKDDGLKLPEISPTPVKEMSDEGLRRRQ